MSSPSYSERIAMTDEIFKRQEERDRERERKKEEGREGGREETRKTQPGSGIR